jgi:lipoprotein NlpI
VSSIIKLISSSIIVGAVLLTQGCVSSDNISNKSASMDQLVIAEPMPVSYKSEIAIARLSEVILRAEVTDEQRAQLYYDRGVIYDSVGLRSLARLDFNRALRLKPNLVNAYNFIGIHYTQMQEFMQAYDAFDSVLDLAPEHEYAYLNRGIALYYGGRPKLALDDFYAFHKIQIDDPYRVLWMYLAEYNVDSEAANIGLKMRADNVHDKTWAKNVIRLYLGEINQRDFIAQLTDGVTSNKELTDRLCEAYFYLGKYNQLQGNQNIAANFFKLALGTNVYEFVEHRYAKLELTLMREAIKGSVEPK